ncbi:copper amine oxidase N-terminal domain-containing protein [Paenibacillus plantiphilus]|nr:copper amine oxidase N-terminal domain-containing protein [Paenibacillus plantiphilus]
MNNKPSKMPSKPFTVNGTAYLPLRFISETLGAAVDWRQKEHKIVIQMQ